MSPFQISASARLPSLTGGAVGGGCMSLRAVPTLNTSVCRSTQIPRRAGWANTADDLRQAEARSGADSSSGIIGKPGTYSKDPSQGTLPGARVTASAVAPGLFFRGVA